MEGGCDDGCGGGATCVGVGGDAKEEDGGVQEAGEQKEEEDVEGNPCGSDEKEVKMGGDAF